MKKKSRDRRKHLRLMEGFHKGADVVYAVTFGVGSGRNKINKLTWVNPKLIKN